MVDDNRRSSMNNRHLCHLFYPHLLSVHTKLLFIASIIRVISFSFPINRIRILELKLILFANSMKFRMKYILC